ncbi:MAG: rpoN [Ramlibacter sp.]|nr:rpoN [Ramlibacter sp.]
MTQLALQATTALQPALSPRLQQAVRLLQMSSIDFAQVVRGALDTNPFLEIDESQPTADEPIPLEAPGRLEESGTSSDSWGSDPLPRARLDGSEGVFDTLIAPISLAAHLLSQLNVLALSERDRVLASVVVESLDEDGYLRMSLEELEQAVVLLPAADPTELLIALRRVQALDPAGVGARSVAECLELQLHSIADRRQRALASTILKDHLPALAGRDTAGLARRLQADPAAVQAACAAIRRFDPRPGWRYGAPTMQYVTPDVIVRKSRGRWTATLNEAVVPRVRVNRNYADLFRSNRCAGDAELGAHLQEARWTVRNVEQRFSTILSVSQAILKRQQHFLAYGAMAMKPLALREIAEEVGVHESTVSRVTNNKFMATPCGVFELKYFFSRGLATDSGAECSPTAIRSLIAEMIAAESPDRPLSDVELARSLSGQGFQVARRTVTKYRQLLRIEPVERRRAVAA